MTGASMRSVAYGLRLAASPVFAVMACLAGMGGGPADVLCSGAGLSGMVPMYLLMSAVHVTPWLELAGRRP